MIVNRKRILNDHTTDNTIVINNDQFEQTTSSSSHLHASQLSTDIANATLSSSVTTDVVVGVNRRRSLSTIDKCVANQRRSYVDRRSCRYRLSSNISMSFLLLLMLMLVTESASVRPSCHKVGECCILSCMAFFSSEWGWDDRAYTIVAMCTWFVFNVYVCIGGVDRWIYKNHSTNYYYHLGFQHYIDEPGCDLVAVDVNKCTGYCLSFAFPTGDRVTQNGVSTNRHKITVRGKCCRMIETQWVCVWCRCSSRIYSYRLK